MEHCSEFWVIFAHNISIPWSQSQELFADADRTSDHGDDAADLGKKDAPECPG